MNFRSIMGWGLSEGTLAPDFSLTGIDRKSYSLSQYRGKKVVLYFYPRAFTTGCTKQACSFRDEYLHMKQLGLELLGISTDEVSVLQNFVQTHSLPFMVLSDASKSVSRAYEVLLPIGIANRVTFLIGPDGKIERTFRFLPWKRYARALLERSAANVKL